jgi:elongation factor Ts
MGGTFSYFPKTYQKKFITECFRAANEYSSYPSPSLRGSLPAGRHGSGGGVIKTISLLNSNSKKSTSKGTLLKEQPSKIDPKFSLLQVKDELEKILNKKIIFVNDCIGESVKKALDEAGGDEEKAIEILRKSGQSKAAKKAEREAHEGVVISYVHSNNRVASLVKLFCETDFVARNEEFQQLAKDLAMHISAMNPTFLNPEDVPLEIIEKEREIWTEQMKEEKKPKEIMDKIMEGKERKYREEISLLTQSFVKDPDLKIEDLITQKISKIGENIQIGEFSRFEL